jgi:hypothetical protein
MSRIVSSIVGLVAIVVAGILVAVGQPIVEQRVGHANPPPTESSSASSSRI